MEQKLSERLLQKLKANALEQREDPVHGTLFLLFPGMGPEGLLALDGKVLISGSLWDDFTGYQEANTDQAHKIITAGAKKTGIPELLSLLPSPSVNSETCGKCEGDRWVKLWETPETLEIVCPACSGLGWQPK